VKKLCTGYQAADLPLTTPTRWRAPQAWWCIWRFFNWSSYSSSLFWPKFAIWVWFGWTVKLVLCTFWVKS